MNVRLNEKAYSTIDQDARRNVQTGMSVKRNTCGDDVLTGGIIVIGLAEAAHLAAVFFGWSFSLCVMAFWGLVGVTFAAGLAVLFVRRFERSGKKAGRAETAAGEKADGPGIGLGKKAGRAETAAGEKADGPGTGSGKKAGRAETAAGEKADGPGTGSGKKAGRAETAAGEKADGPGTGSGKKAGRAETAAGEKADGPGIGSGKKAGRAETAEWVLYGIFAVLLLAQLIYIGTGENVYRQGDMTTETVGSFLSSDSIYQVNPMTGQPYTAGIPFRLKILCLPTLYGSICKLTGLSPVIVVQIIIPVLTLFGSYVAFAGLGRCLFPESRKNRGCFLVAAALLLWAGNYMYGMDGFNLLGSGWRGVAIRNAVLVPWLLSLCIRKKWVSVILCVLAEACIVWTLYGMGVCLVVIFGLAAARLCCRVFPGKYTAADVRSGREETK